jgi:hypothetical protein
MQSRNPRRSNHPRRLEILLSQHGHAGGLTGQSKLNHARLQVSSSSASRDKLTAPKLSSSRSGRLAPTIAAVIPGCASTHAMATCAIDFPRGSKQRHRGKPVDRCRGSGHNYARPLSTLRTASAWRYSIRSVSRRKRRKRVSPVTLCWRWEAFCRADGSESR